MRRVVATWWPLALSWILMSAEPSMLAAVVAGGALPDVSGVYIAVAFSVLASVMQTGWLGLRSRGVRKEAHA